MCGKALIRADDAFAIHEVLVEDVVECSRRLFVEADNQGWVEVHFRAGELHLISHVACIAHIDCMYCTHGLHVLLTSSPLSHTLSELHLMTDIAGRIPRLTSSFKCLLCQRGRGWLWRGGLRKRRSQGMSSSPPLLWPSPRRRIHLPEATGSHLRLGRPCSPPWMPAAPSHHNPANRNSVTATIFRSTVALKPLFRGMRGRIMSDTTLKKQTWKNSVSCRGRRCFELGDHGGLHDALHFLF